MSNEADAALDHQLVAIERQFWDASSNGDGDFYRRNATEDAVFVFPAPTGTIDRATCATIVDSNDTPWRWYEMADVRLVPICADATVMTYRATAQPEDSNPFSMLVSSAYVRRHDAWLLAFHQQTIVKT